MKKLRFLLEYNCNPIWVLDEKGGLIDNDLPSDLKKCHDLDDSLEEIAKDFDNLFENNDIYFGYHGFNNESEKRIFLDKVYKAINFLRKYAKNNYKIQIDFNESDF